MKTRYIALFAAALALTVTSCTKDNDLDEHVPGTDIAGLPENCIPLNLKIGAEGGTKTSLNGTSTVWSAEDNIGIFSPEAYYEWENAYIAGSLFYNSPLNNKALAVASGAGTPAVTFGKSSIYDDEVIKFTGNFGWNTDYDKHTFYAYYPYAKGADALTKAEAVPFSIPTVQEQSGPSNSDHIGTIDFLYASAELKRPADVTADKTPADAELLLRFKHAFALLAINVQSTSSTPITLTAMKVASTSQPLAGDCTVDITTGTVTMGKTTDQTGSVTDGSTSLKAQVRFPEGLVLERYKPVTVYMLVNAGDYSDGLRFTFETETQQQVFNSSCTVEAGGIYSPGSTLSINKLVDKPTYELHIVDFENVPETYLAKSASGSNYYDGSYTGWEEPATGLWFGNNYGTYGQSTGTYIMYDGGMFLSQFNDMTSEGYTNQCSVYYKDETTGFGGRNGSRTFGFGFGYNDSIPNPYGRDNRPEIHFTDDKKEAVIDHAYVTNTTYAALSMKKGDSFNQAFSYEKKSWFALTASGYKADGTLTSSVVFYLADFRTEDAGGVVTEWSKLDLSSLGEVNKIVFNLHSSDSGDYGMNTPSYFAIDDIAVRVPIVE